MVGARGREGGAKLGRLLRWGWHTCKVAERDVGGVLALSYHAPNPCTVCLVRPIVARVNSGHVPVVPEGARGSRTRFVLLVTFLVVNGEVSVLEVHTTTEAIAEYEPDTYAKEATKAEEQRIVALEREPTL